MSYALMQHCVKDDLGLNKLYISVRSKTNVSFCENLGNFRYMYVLQIWKGPKNMFSNFFWESGWQHKGSFSYKPIKSDSCPLQFFKKCDVLKWNVRRSEFTFFSNTFLIYYYIICYYIYQYQNRRHPIPNIIFHRDS